MAAGIGKGWVSRFTLDDIEEKATISSKRLSVVATFESVQVPAGSFKTAKIEKYDFDFGRLLMEYWYAPEVKWYVKFRSYWNGGLTEEELLRFESKHSGENR